MHYMQQHDQVAANPDLVGHFQADQQEYHLGDPISVTLYITNKADEARFVFIPKGRSNGIQAKADGGPEVKQKSMSEEPEPGLVAETKIPPGETVARRFVLSDWMIFDQPGSYALVCSIPLESNSKSLREESEDRTKRSVTVDSQIHITVVNKQQPRP